MSHLNLVFGQNFSSKTTAKCLKAKQLCYLAMDLFYKIRTLCSFIAISPFFRPNFRPCLPKKFPSNSNASTKIKFEVAKIEQAMSLSDVINFDGRKLPYDFPTAFSHISKTAKFPFQYFRLFRWLDASILTHKITT